MLRNTVTYYNLNIFFVCALHHTDGIISFLEYFTHSYMLQGCLCQQFLSWHSWTLEFSAYRMLSFDLWI